LLLITETASFTAYNQTDDIPPPLEVLEATGNFTEAALKGRDIYSPESFPFQKHVTSRSSA
jgi:hypothetical protein